MSTGFASRKHLTAVSLFSGAGGMDVGFTRAGFEITLASDIDKDACETYRANHGEVIVEGDARKLLPKLQTMESVDVLFGGPPCQGFSVAGKMDPDDERSQLIDSYFDALDALRPRAFVCENVKALAVLSRWQGVRDRIIERASKSYVVEMFVLNSNEFGVPQSRERMFLIGIRKDQPRANPMELRSAINAALEQSKKRPPSVGDIVRTLGPAGGQGNSLICKAKITYAKAPVLRKSAYAGMLFNGAGRPLAAKGHSTTLPASMGGNRTPIVDELEIFSDAKSFVEDYHKSLLSNGKPKSGSPPSRLRRLTVNECMAIQTFPSNYVFKGSQSSVFKQIGNAVPCELAHAVGLAVKDLVGLRLETLDHARGESKGFTQPSP